MRRSVGFLLVGIEVAILSWWFLGQRFETGLDALQYHRMASAIVSNGLAPWILNPLSYIGMYPGSDSSGIPFLAAEFALSSGSLLSATVLAYDSVLFVVFGLGLFLLVTKITNQGSLSIFAVLLGSLAYGFFTTLSWSLDERSFNVALAPMFLLMVLPRPAQGGRTYSVPKFVALTLTCFIMLVSHLSFLLLIPFLAVIPLMYEVVRHRYAARARRASSLIYFGTVAASPLLLLAALNQLGLLSSFGLEYQLESSALFSGNSPLVFLANAFVFLGTRVGPVTLGSVVIGLAYLATRPRLLSSDITIGVLLVGGFLSLPIVVYSKDLLTPIFVVVGSVGLGAVITRMGKRRSIAVVIAGAIVISGSVAFTGWNSARTSRTAATLYLAPGGVTPETRDANLWLQLHETGNGCVYGNNPVLLQQVTNEPGVAFCTGLPVDVLINRGTAAVTGRSPLRVVYAGVNGVNPGDWYQSPYLDQVASDFAALPSLTYQAGRALLEKYNVSYVVVDLQMSSRVPLYNYQGTAYSPFFAELSQVQYPVYRSDNLAVFQIQQNW